MDTTLDTRHMVVPPPMASREATSSLSKQASSHTSGDSLSLEVIWYAAFALVMYIGIVVDDKWPSTNICAF